MWILEYITDFFFPPRCFLCKKDGTALCDICLSRLSGSITVLPDWIHATYSFRDESVRKCIHQIKYYHRKDLIFPLVKKTLSDGLLSFIGDKDKAVLVPIPMHRKRRWKRGYDHALLIAQSYGALLDISVNSNLLLRTRLPEQQAKIKHIKDRKKNILGSFAINQEEKIEQDATIILIDDTTTTHTTFSEAKNVLERNGFSNIKAIALAH